MSDKFLCSIILETPLRRLLMDQSISYVAGDTQATTTTGPHGHTSHVVRRVRNAILPLGLAGALIATGGSAQQPTISQSHDAPLEVGRLSVRPKTMTLGQETARAGLQWLDSLYPGDSLISEAIVYVPPRCVGKHRCPLTVWLHGSSMNGLSMITWDEEVFERFADSNGVILLAPTSHSIPAQDWGSNYLRDTVNVDVPRVDAALRTILQHYAVDPERIALVGASSGSGLTLDLGYVNGDVFSRVVAYSGFTPFLVDHEFDILTPHGPRPLFFIGLDAAEAASIQMPTFVAWLRHAEYSVTYAEDNRGHYSRERALEGMQWLMSSWR
jgi:predicted esterase